MEYSEFEEMFLKELNQNNIDKSINVNKFYEYMKLLLEWNKKINLTSITDEQEFIIKHFIDSLTVSRYIVDKSKLIDVGTGAGFPGLPLKLFYVELDVTLIDSVNKKVNVINEIIEKLRLTNIEAIHIRAEDFAKYNREKYDFAVSRAVANMSTLVEYLIPFVKIGGKIICMKGPNLETEINDSKNAIRILGGEIECIDNITIDKNLERNIVIIKKIKETPNKYPRGQGKPLKEPIK